MNPGITQRGTSLQQPRSALQADWPLPLEPLLGDAHTGNAFAEVSSLRTKAPSDRCVAR